MPSSTRPLHVSGWGYMRCGGPAWWRWWLRGDVLELLGREEGDIGTWRWFCLVPGNLCKAASLHPSWPRKKSWKQQGTLKGGCNLAGVPLRCTPPWPSVRVVIVDISFLKLTKYDRITCYLCFKLFLIILANTSQNSLTGGICHFTIQYQRNWTICAARPYILYIPYATTMCCAFIKIYIRLKLKCSSFWWKHSSSWYLQGSLGCVCRWCWDEMCSSMDWWVKQRAER